MHPNNFKKFFEENLNDEQKKAVCQKSGSLLVIAGAGSGKTRVITSRIINLIINEKIEPQSIIALTFTNKAALEMKERIVHFLGYHAQESFIGTFHSYCLNLLKKNIHYLPYAQFSILDADDQQQLLHSIIKRNGLQKKIMAKNLAYQISIRKNSNAEATPDPLFEQLYTLYEQEKSLSKSLDFDDLLLEVLSLFTKNNDFKTEFQKKIRHILIDEYQDTNLVQHELLKQMALHKKKLVVDSLCAVGDEDQSIYSWRGATVTNIMNFKNDFPGTMLIKIEQNYRSVEPILTVANHVIDYNVQRNPKKLWSERKAENRVTVITCLSGYQEGEAVAQALKAVQKSNTVQSCAVLYRAHYQSRLIEEALLKSSIAYKIIGGIQFYERKEIKDILAYLRLAVNPFDRVSFFRILNTPARGLGEKVEQEIHEIWHREPLFSFIDVINFLVTSTIRGQKAQELRNFLKIFKNISHADTPTHCINHILSETKYYTYLKDSYETKEAEVKIDNIKELLRAAKHYEEQKQTTITAFLYEIALMQEKINNQGNAPEKVYLMTLHSAKGLEFDFVLLTGLEENVFPSAHAVYDVDAVEEERRLFYVGMTRAKEYLLITHARYRYTFGSMNDQRPSRFLDEIPHALAAKYDCSQWHAPEFYGYFTRWLCTTVEQKKTKIFTFGIAKEVVTEPQPKTTPATFKKYQSVRHSKFGIGIVETVEQKDTNIFYVTAKFKSGVKKVKADFLEKV